MFGLPEKTISDERIKDILNSVESVNEEDNTAVLEIVEPLVKVIRTQKSAAEALLKIISGEHFPIETALQYLSEIYDFYETDDEVIGRIGASMEAVRDYDDLNAPPPDNVLFGKVLNSLSKLAFESEGDKAEAIHLDGLATTARLCARQYDELAKKSYARLVELLPQKAWPHYGQGLYCKTRGLFQQGVISNQKAIEVAAEPTQAYFWNLGICATGAGQGEVALKVWKELGQKIEMGRFGLPEGVYPSCKVKLAKFPLAERSSENDYPELEETIWIERLSPCHGIIRSVLYQELGVDYGDVILFDGAPITYHTYGDEQIAVFPHLATLRRQKYQFFDFCGTQSENGELGQLSEFLERDSVVYSHTENYKVLCSPCWNDQDLQHEHDETEEQHVVMGRIAAPPEVSPRTLLRDIDQALERKPRSRIFSPDLCSAAGFSGRAEIEKRRFEMLRF
jgi:tetratricopeptide (TPR) repeat protein